MAAPAFAASMALAAIWAGLRGTCGLRSCVPPDPVTAQVMKTSWFMVSGMTFLLLSGLLDGLSVGSPYTA
jgi:hypothetical protein